MTDDFLDDGEVNRSGQVEELLLAGEDASEASAFLLRSLHIVSGHCDVADHLHR